MYNFIRFIAYTAFTALICLCSGKSAKSQTEIHQEFKKIDSFLQLQVNTHNIPGIAIAITRGDRIVYQKGFGVASISTAKPLQAFHNFHIASISKTFTATAVMQLAEKGNIDINISLTTYLPYFRMKDDRYRIITIKQLLNHTNVELYNTISQYYKLCDSYLDRDAELKDKMVYPEELISKIFDSRILVDYFTIRPNNWNYLEVPQGNPPLLTTDKQMLNQYYLFIGNIKWINDLSLIYLVNIEKNANDLMGLLKKEYNIE